MVNRSGGLNPKVITIKLAVVSHEGKVISAKLYEE